MVPQAQPAITGTTILDSGNPPLILNSTVLWQDISKRRLETCCLHCPCVGSALLYFWSRAYQLLWVLANPYRSSWFDLCTFHVVAVGGMLRLISCIWVHSLADVSGPLRAAFAVLESRLSKALVFPDSPLPVRHDIGETEHRTEIRRGGTSGYKASVIHSKRNHTIGLGEQDQLDLIVTESVIRWASCTHIQGAPSLRSSLVC
ncbi:hypothetical protein CK203_067885 [Vitis vinifera]|uniref:Uncharacterized protein n=1 Tax=Vitis vinifera TaxID=29760 RepID=A0A438BZR5_VITVI|nr:hypothetical protein CK203_067885 [Vitis vinifera]